MSAAQSNIHAYVTWAKERLDEVEATLVPLEGRLGELDREARVKAEAALQEVRAGRDAFREAVKTRMDMNEAAWDRARATLERDWAAFEVSVRKYFDAAREQGGQQAAVFQARADAQLNAWQEGIGTFQKTASEFTAERKAEAEAALQRMEAEAGQARARLERLGRAGAESWSAFEAALAESRAAFDRAVGSGHDGSRPSA